MKGDDLVQLADCFGIRAAAITGLVEVRERARFAARTSGDLVTMVAMRERLYAYLELDSYLTGQGITGAAARGELPRSWLNARQGRWLQEEAGQE